jgi:hypothetical protein
MRDCAVLYLERFCNPPQFARAFLNSTLRFDPGAEYDFVPVLKGFNEGIISEPLKEHMLDRSQSPLIFHVSDDRSALGAMLEVAKQLPHEKILVLLSWSRILAPNWLRSYLSAFDTVENCGIVGATGSFERNNYKDVSQPFPNIGIRTTGFMMSRKLYIECADGRVGTREGELQFESGPDGYTKQIMRRGLKPVVVDRLGKAWQTEEWPQSKTFRSGYQEGLLIADNRTHGYAVGKAKKRRFLADIAWGPGVAETPAISWFKRYKLNRDWKTGK